MFGWPKLWVFPAKNWKKRLFRPMDTIETDLHYLVYSLCTWSHDFFLSIKVKHRIHRNSSKQYSGSPISCRSNKVQGEKFNLKWRKDRQGTYENLKKIEKLKLNKLVNRKWEGWWYNIVILCIEEHCKIWHRVHIFHFIMGVTECYQQCFSLETSVKIRMIPKRLG